MARSPRTGVRTIGPSATEAGPAPGETGEPDAACAVAHGTAPAPSGGRTLMAVFASPVAAHLLRYAADTGFRPILLEPDPGRTLDGAPAGTEVVTRPPDGLDRTVDVVVTDHHREELGAVLRQVLACPCRWIGVLGNPRHPGPHVTALTGLGVPAEDIARVHRPVGLNIGSRTPPEIAIATLAGLLADRNDRPGGFIF
ncbi:XdhC family protein [Sphaerisporangium corydalis]|uniref:XdhC family protein n=1 Tax=Sphaerisporangium corydalis TaxID=1441875 RepID=A0ABV9ER21_9ACTN|nr:XdhC family protein [Sphaerisporangium corydalis]